MDDLLKKYQVTYKHLQKQAREITELAVEAWNFGTYERVKELMNEVYEIRFNQYVLGIEFCNLFRKMLEVTKEPEEIKTLEKIINNFRKSNQRKRNVLVKFDDEIDKLIRNAQQNQENKLNGGQK